MTAHELHKLLVACHIVAGSIGLISVWPPLMAKKGDSNHKRWGRVFVWSMLTVGCFAAGMSVVTIAAPVATHPHFDFSREILEGVFGWMMLYLATLTLNLAWYGRECVRNRGDHGANRGPLNIALQVVLLALSVNTVVRGVLLEQPLMIGISTIGFATVFTNAQFLLRARPGPNDWLREHLKGLVGAGISVYTAFFAFGAVRLMPELALSPLLWSAPLTVGLAIILWHWRAIALKSRRAFAR